MRRLFFLPILLFCTGIFADQIPIPKLVHRVTDLTSTLSEEEVSSLENKLKTFEKRKGSQVVLVIVPTTGDETIEQYSIRLAEDWKIGRKGIADGVIFLVAKDDRKMRFEIGRGLEGAIPDVISKRIQLEYIRPLFKEGKYYKGIDQGIDKILGLIDGEQLPEPSSTSYESSSSEAEDDQFGLYIGALIVIGVVIGFLFKKLFSLLQAGLATYIGYWVGGLLGFSLEVMLPLLVIFFILLCIIYIAAKNPGSGGGGWSGGSWSSYGSGDSGWSSSSSSDSFSGGGGDFSGGGSSSDW
ncbi:TPM domain-containing protein [Leptospira licerasiae]|uniref:PF04536 family protein n=1 Tax=Leptospira licerasiae str. MMD4847 TaxID=1049971 RepID=A0ABP2R9J7_9LEPT|nr:TPM domain-containing protein [Leptospira licerasiae]EIE00690.1 repair protein [Leptospira licerasiae serovar Varillal str. VAR 010]EJZ41035.1 PF04536 family protein [Leptospira licerasiae str. MMD4847]